MDEAEIHRLASEYAMKAVGQGDRYGLTLRTYVDAYKQGWIDARNPFTPSPEDDAEEARRRV